MENKSYLAKVLEILPNGDAILELPPEVVEIMGWSEGTIVEIDKNEFGEIVIKDIVA